jgi:hypothetical protein
MLKAAPRLCAPHDVEHRQAVAGFVQLHRALDELLGPLVEADDRRAQREPTQLHQARLALLRVHA